jgi:SAM-dependent methyltransferase
VGAASPIEITDLLWAVTSSGERLPVPKAEVLARLGASGQRRARRIVSRMPASTGMLDDAHVDALGVRVHCELQRLTEELQLPRRVTALLKPLVSGLPGPVRVVDVGCGLGYVIRWLATTCALGRDVELVGVDLNPVLAGEAARLAHDERLRCWFIHGDAFEPGVAVEDGARTIIISTGLMHHFPSAELPGFFAAQHRLRVAAFAHWDIAPCLWSTFGAWMFHQARMREPVARHDGVLSARRAHTAAVLAAAAADGAPGYAVQVLERTRWHPLAVDVLRPVTGVRQ